jgi:hypothetical protein
VPIQTLQIVLMNFSDRSEPDNPHPTNDTLDVKTQNQPTSTYLCPTGKAAPSFPPQPPPLPRPWAKNNSEIRASGRTAS